VLDQSEKAGIGAKRTFPGKKMLGSVREKEVMSEKESTLICLSQSIGDVRGVLTSRGGRRCGAHR